ncbi:PREDICTED: putative uncharacterized protein CXorf58 homolog, partial [Rhinopithecus bieti]|uniref:Chromosome X open reading frame 58 n=1 Tax=Rhinopithecus bieti TaxID=61621 RepID=A0A2K6JZY8_RHIBE
MNRSSNVPGKGILKLGTRSLGKVHRVHFANAPNSRSLLSMLKDISAQIIQRAWLSHTNKMIFRLLKHAICAAEFCVTHEILKKVSPLEAKLIKDPTMQCKIRFRFRGETFPPFIVFKIFLHTDGHGYKYFSGKNVLMPSSKYRSFFDEAPAFSGGRNNSWRKLNLESIPRTTLMYDIVHYSESGVISNRLRNEMKFLLQRPVTQEIHKHQLRIVSEK